MAYKGSVSTMSAVSTCMGVLDDFLNVAHDWHFNVISVGNIMVSVLWDSSRDDEFLVVEDCPWYLTFDDSFDLLKVGKELIEINSLLNLFDFSVGVGVDILR